jgi:hypothetical protein
VRVRVSCMRERGAPRPRNEIGQGRSVSGDLLVEEARDETLGRTLRVARVAPQQPRDPPLLPSLSDVVLLWMGPQGFVLAGFETIGDAQYAQSWWCRPL